MALAAVATMDNEDSDDDNMPTNVKQKGEGEEFNQVCCCNDEGSDCMNNEDEENKEDIDT